MQEQIIYENELCKFNSLKAKHCSYTKTKNALTNVINWFNGMAGGGNPFFVSEYDIIGFTVYSLAKKNKKMICDIENFKTEIDTNNTKIDTLEINKNFNWGEYIKILIANDLHERTTVDKIAVATKRNAEYLVSVGISHDQIHNNLKDIPDSYKADIRIKDLLEYYNRPHLATLRQINGKINNFKIESPHRYDDLKNLNGIWSNFATHIMEDTALTNKRTDIPTQNFVKNVHDMFIAKIEEILDHKSDPTILMRLFDEIEHFKDQYMEADYDKNFGDVWSVTFSNIYDSVKNKISEIIWKVVREKKTNTIDALGISNTVDVSDGAGIHMSREAYIKNLDISVSSIDARSIDKGTVKALCEFLKIIKEKRWAVDNHPHAKLDRVTALLKSAIDEWGQRNDDNKSTIAKELHEYECNLPFDIKSLEERMKYLKKMQNDAFAGDASDTSRESAKEQASEKQAIETKQMPEDNDAVPNIYNPLYIRLHEVKNVEEKASGAKKWVKAGITLDYIHISPHLDFNINKYFVKFSQKAGVDKNRVRGFRNFKNQVFRMPYYYYTAPIGDAYFVVSHLESIMYKMQGVNIYSKFDDRPSVRDKILQFLLARQYSYNDYRNLFGCYDDGNPVAALINDARTASSKMHCVKYYFDELTAIRTGKHLLDANLYEILKKHVLSKRLVKKIDKRTDAAATYGQIVNFVATSPVVCS